MYIDIYLMYRFYSELQLAIFIIVVFDLSINIYVICHKYVNYFNNSFDKQNLVKSTHKYADLSKIVKYVFSANLLKYQEIACLPFSNSVCKNLQLDRRVLILFSLKKKYINYNKNRSAFISF